MDSDVQGGLFNLDNLFVPININNTHWLFLWTDFNAQAIEIYDSIGGLSNPRNRKYMWAMRQFLYDLKFKGSPVDNRPNFEEWKSSWTTRDMTRQSPKQAGNDDDCGVFTILLIYLISQGVNLRRTSYDQHIVTDRKLRQMIALSLIKCNELTALGEIDNFIILERRNTTTASRFKKQKKS